MIKGLVTIVPKRVLKSPKIACKAANIVRKGTKNFGTHIQGTKILQAGKNIFPKKVPKSVPKRYQKLFQKVQKIRLKGNKMKYRINVKKGTKVK